MDRVGGIASLRPLDARAASARLDAAGVVHSLREEVIRLGPYCYTTDADVDATLAAMET
jgi:selenocysteine lyase/cysteine desulfurase